MTLREVLTQENKDTIGYIEERLRLDPAVFGVDSIFSGMFAVKDGSIVSIDGDVYSLNSEIDGYQFWEATENTEFFHKGDLCMTVFQTCRITK